VNNMHKPLRTLVSAAVLGMLSSASVQAGGFSLYTESNGYSAGNFAAGVAAEAADASIGWYNPAGLVLIKDQQMVFGGVGIFPSAKITGNSTFRTAPYPNYVQTFSNLDVSNNAFVPSFHYALPLTDKVTFGLSVVSPFGLATDTGAQSAVRYQGTFTEVLTANVAPELGAKVTDNFSVGAGLDLQWARVKFNQIVGAPTAYSILPFPQTAIDTLSYNKATSFGVGYHVGVLAMFNENHTRIGLNYQSKMRHNFHGYSNLIGPLATMTTAAPPGASGVFSSNSLWGNPAEFPDILTLSAYQDVNERWAILGSIVYTGWSCFKSLQLNNVAAPIITGGSVKQGLVNERVDENYSNAWRAAIGANYKVNQQWLLRVGGGYDQTPINDAYRDVRLPDTDRWALSVGTHYQMRDNIGFDLGYTHLFGTGNGPLFRTEAVGATSTYNVTATTSAHADLIGAQLVWAIDKAAPAPVGK
jgi:long-chain fatty acid transport protein